MNIYRYGEWTELWADDGDWPFYNASLTQYMIKRNSLPSTKLQSSPSKTIWGSEALVIDRQEGITIGGTPEFIGVTLHKVNEDFSDGNVQDTLVLSNKCFI